MTNADRLRGRVPRALDVAVVLGLAALLTFLHQEARKVGWINSDEMVILLHAQYFSPAQYFFVPDVYRLFSGENLTPWVTLSFDADLWAFGLDPGILRARQIVDAVLLTAVFYAFVSRWARRPTAFVAALVVGLSAPVAVSSTFLPMRHYLEGMILCVLALSAYHAAEASGGRRRVALRILSAAFYALATTAKEVFVPLIVVLFALRKGPWAGRARALAPHLGVALAYCAWRYFMLGSSLGGYGAHIDGSPLATYLSGAGYLLRAGPGALLQVPAASWVLSALVAALVALLLVRKQVGPAALAATLACVCGPVLPVGWVAELAGIENMLRVFLVPVCAGAIGLAFGVEQLRSRRARAAVLTVASACCFVSAPALLGHIAKLSSPERTNLPRCVDFVLESGPERVVEPVQFIFVPLLMAGASHLRETLTGEPGATVFAGPLALPHSASDLPVYVQRASPECFVRDDERRAEILRQSRRAAVDRRVAPHLEWGPNRVGWRLEGPGGLDATHLDLVVRSADGAFWRPRTEASGRLAALRRTLWLHRVRPPAELLFEWKDAAGRVRYTPPAPVPERYFDFWEFAAPTPAPSAASSPSQSP